MRGYLLDDRGCLLAHRGGGRGRRSRALFAGRHDPDGDSSDGHPLRGQRRDERALQEAQLSGPGRAFAEDDQLAVGMVVCSDYVLRHTLIEQALHYCQQALTLSSQHQQLGYRDGFLLLFPFLLPFVLAGLLASVLPVGMHLARVVQQQAGAGPCPIGH